MINIQSITTKVAISKTFTELTKRQEAELRALESKLDQLQKAILTQTDIPH